MDLKLIPLKDLHYQFRAELAPNPVLSKTNEMLNCPITMGPLVDLLREYQEKGRDPVLESIATSSYSALFQHTNNVGYLVNWQTGEQQPAHYSETDILNKAEKFFSIFDSIKTRGYLGKGFEQRFIVALDRPLGCNGPELPDGSIRYDIWSGHHRAAALTVLGYAEASVVVLRSGRER